MTWVVDALDGVDRLAIDTAPIIYFVERHVAFGATMRSVFGRIDAGQVQGATSTITLTELLVLPFQKGDDGLASAYKDILLRSAHFEVLDVSPDIAEEAARLRSQVQIAHSRRFASRNSNETRLSGVVDERRQPAENR